MILPTDAAARKRIPIFSGVIKYFPRALAEVAKVSMKGNEQHHPGQPLHWDKSKSTDQLDALARHLVDSLDPEHDRIETLAQVAWRALAELETACEQSAANAATSEQVPAVPRKFKVGARVRCSGGYDFDPCDGTVVAVGETWVDVRTDTGTPAPASYSGWRYLPHELRKLNWMSGK